MKKHSAPQAEPWQPLVYDRPGAKNGWAGTQKKLPGFWGETPHIFLKKTINLLVTIPHFLWKLRFTMFYPHPRKIHGAVASERATFVSSFNWLVDQLVLSIFVKVYVPCGMRIPIDSQHPKATWTRGVGTSHCEDTSMNSTDAMDPGS